MAETGLWLHSQVVEDWWTGKDALPYFPYIFTAFLFILFANFLALIPASFSPTSHIAGDGDPGR